MTEQQILPPIDPKTARNGEPMWEIYHDVAQRHSLRQVATTPDGSGKIVDTFGEGRSRDFRLVTTNPNPRS